MTIRTERCETSTFRYALTHQVRDWGTDLAAEPALQFSLTDEIETLAEREREFLLPFASRRRSRHASGAIHAMI